MWLGQNNEKDEKLENEEFRRKSFVVSGEKGDYLGNEEIWKNIKFCGWVRMMRRVSRCKIKKLEKICFIFGGEKGE